MTSQLDAGLFWLYLTHLSVYPCISEQPRAIGIGIYFLHQMVTMASNPPTVGGLADGVGFSQKAYGMNSSESQADRASFTPNESGGSVGSGDLLILPDPGAIGVIRVGDVISITQIVLGPSEQYLAIATRFGVRYAPSSGANVIAILRQGVPFIKFVDFTAAQAGDVRKFFDWAAITPGDEPLDADGNILEQPRAEPFVKSVIGRDAGEWLIAVHRDRFEFFEGTSENVGVIQNEYHVFVERKTTLSKSPDSSLG
jgi:hypothetical protein